MEPETTEDILELRNGHIVSAALGAALELGVFWLLAEKPLDYARSAKANEPNSPGSARSRQIARQDAVRAAGRKEKGY